MSWIIKAGRATCLITLLIGAFFGAGQNASAQSSTRATTILVPYIEYEWWLLSWSGSQFLCQVLVDHEGMPTISEVSQSCGADYANAWTSTPACKTTLDCRGVYMHLISTQAKEREVIVELPPPMIWVTLEGCTPQPPENLCPSIPTLVLTGEEPLPNERITAVQGIFDGEPFYCQSDICKLPLRATPLLGSRD